MKTLKFDDKNTIDLHAKACYLTTKHHAILKSEKLIRINLNGMDIADNIAIEKVKMIATYDRFEHIVYFKSAKDEGALICKNNDVSDITVSFGSEYILNVDCFENFKHRNHVSSTEEQVLYDLESNYLLHHGKHFGYEIKTYTRKSAYEYVDALIKHAPKFGYTHVVSGSHFIMGWPVYTLIACTKSEIDQHTEKALAYGDVKIYDLKKLKEYKFIKYPIHG